MDRIEAKRFRKVRRQMRVRRRVFGTPAAPRLNVFRSLNHIYGQLIDDIGGVTLVSASSMSPEVRDKLKSGGNRAAAREVGKLLGQKALTAGIKKAVFDRAGYKFHGRVKELAEGAREAGIKV